MTTYAIDGKIDARGHNLQRPRFLTERKGGCQSLSVALLTPEDGVRLGQLGMTVSETALPITAAASLGRTSLSLRLGHQA